MKPLAISLLVFAVGGFCFAAGYRVAAIRAVPKRTHLAVSLITDRCLFAVTTVIEDEKLGYVTLGDRIELTSDGQGLSTVRPDGIIFQRYDFYSPTKPREMLAFVQCSEREKEETFIVRDGKVLKVDLLAREIP